MKAFFIATGNEEDLGKVEVEIDRRAAKLFHLTDDELREAKESLAILLGHEFEEEEVEEEIELEEPLEPIVRLKDATVEEGKPV